MNPKKYNKIPLMTEACTIGLEAEYDYSTPLIKITGVYINGVKLLQEEIVDTILEDVGVESIEQQIRELHLSHKEEDEFLRDNRWPDTPIWWK